MTAVNATERKKRRKNYECGALQVQLLAVALLHHTLTLYNDLCSQLLT
jgi:hypothetical protein